MRVADVMQHQDLVTCSPDTLVADAARRMCERRVGACLVMDGSQLVGIFTERDLLRVVGSGEEVGALPVSQVMTAKVTLAPPDADLLWTADTMRRLGVRHLPVGEDRSMVIGIVSLRDLFAVAEAVLRLDTENGLKVARDLLGATRE